MKNYKIIRQLGSGSFSTVWLALDSRNEEIILKKYNKNGQDQASREFFFLSALKPARVPDVYEYDVFDTEPWLTMQYITGAHPAAHSFGTLNLKHEFFYKLCNEIVTIQAAGICLNDIKPENIILRNGEPWIIDLGLAATNNFNDGSFRGSIAYSSPEKLKYTTSNFASDIFAIGILYLELTNGKHPATEMGEEAWKKLLHSESDWHFWLQSQSLPQSISSWLDYHPARRPTATRLLQYFGTLCGIVPPLRWGIINDYVFSKQQDWVSEIYKSGHLHCNPDDEPERLIDLMVLQSEAAGKPAIVIREIDLINNPESIIGQFSRLTDIALKNISDLLKLPAKLCSIILVQDNDFSPFFARMQTREDTYTLIIDQATNPLIIDNQQFALYLQSVGKTELPETDYRPMSIFACRLFLAALLLPPLPAQELPIPALAAVLDFPVPLKLAEFLEKDWLSQISTALQNGYLILSGNEFSTDSRQLLALPQSLLKKYRTIAAEQGYHLHAALIAIALNDLITAKKEFALQYRLLTRKGFYVSAWQLISLAEKKIGWQNLDLIHKKAKAFLTRRLGDPEKSIALYQKIDVLPQTRDFAVVKADMAIAYQENGELEEAISAYQEALQYFREMQETKDVLRCLNNLAAVYYLMDNYNQCSQIYMEIIRITEASEEKEYARNYHLIAEINLADIFLHKAQWKRARNYARTASDSARRLNLKPYRYQAEIIALVSLFALGEYENLDEAIEQFLNDKSLAENPSLFQEIAAYCLFILQVTAPQKAAQFADQLLLQKLDDYSDNLLLALFCLAWQTRRCSLIPQISQLIKDQDTQNMILSLLKAHPDKMLSQLRALSRKDDAWLYIFYATQLALADLHLKDKRFADELDNLLKVYSFQPLSKIISQASIHTPEHLQLLWEVVSLIHNKTDFNEIIEAILQGIIRIAGLDRAIFFDYQQGVLTPRYALDKALKPLDLHFIQVSQTILLETIAKKETSFFSDLQEDAGIDIHSSILGLGLRSAVCYPVFFDEAVHGVIYSDARSDRIFTEDEKKLLNSLLVQGRSAFEKAILIDNIRHEKLDKLVDSDGKFDNSIIGSSPAMQKIYHLINLVASHNVNVLITGETGTGKELVARAIHNRYAPHKPYTPINCAAIPDTLLESELFGYVKGAFTGADRDKKGLIEITSGGTLFLDEIGDMPPSLQAKILRVIQERRLSPLGSSKIIPVDIRIIAATNLQLERAVEEGTFRQDLYFRLKVIKIDLPGLHERKQDIPLLIQHFISRFNDRFGKSIKGISAPALDLLQNKAFPGNIRELENEIERAMVLCQNDLLTLDLFEDSNINRTYSMEDNIPINWEDYKNFRRQFSNNLDAVYIKKLLKISDNKISIASKQAKISRTQIYRLLELENT